MLSTLATLTIELDSHHRGGDPLKPWVARILGPDLRFGLAREFVKPLRDWSEAKMSWRGRISGATATYMLRSGSVFEICRPTGKSSKRRLVRTFARASDGELVDMTIDDLLGYVGGHSGPTVSLSLLDQREAPSFVGLSDGGPQIPQAFVLDDGCRRYALREGLTYEVRGTLRTGRPAGPFVRAIDGQTVHFDRIETP